MVDKRKKQRVAMATTYSTDIALEIYSCTTYNCNSV